MIIDNLISGGLISNYYCSSQCKHCLYNCSPHWPEDYIDPKLCERIFEKIKILDCKAVHIGGGESLLNPGGLKKVLDIAKESQINIDYVETNSSWYKNHQQAVGILNELKASGLSTLLISISPFHNEFIPFYKVKGVIKACKDSKISVFPWVMDFYEDLNKLDDSKTHKLSEYNDTYAPDYVKNIPDRYWVYMGGRATATFKKIHPLTDLENIINDSEPCYELIENTHFHVDLYNKYIPGLCSGFGIDIDDLNIPLNIKKYPLIVTLYDKGIGGLFKLAKDDFNFSPQEKYLNKCDLCLDIRYHLFNNFSKEFNELSPAFFYANI